MQTSKRLVDLVHQSLGSLRSGSHVVRDSGDISHGPSQVLIDTMKKKVVDFITFYSLSEQCLVWCLVPQADLKQRKKYNHKHKLSLIHICHSCTSHPPPLLQPLLIQVFMLFTNNDCYSHMDKNTSVIRSHLYVNHICFTALQLPTTSTLK